MLWHARKAVERSPAFGTRELWGRRSMWRDFLVIALANLASFGAGELLGYWGLLER